MAPKRRKGFGNHGHGKHKRKKINLMTIRQKNEIRQFGELHPINDRDNVKSYTKVKDVEEVHSSKDLETSDESEEETPVIKQLLAEIGVKEDEPESEKESSESDDSEAADSEDENDSDLLDETSVSESTSHKLKNSNKKHLVLDVEENEESSSEDDIDTDEDENDSDLLDETSVSESTSHKLKNSNKKHLVLDVEENDESSSEDDIDTELEKSQLVTENKADDDEAIDDEDGGDIGEAEANIQETNNEDQSVTHREVPLNEELEDFDGEETEEHILKESDPFTQHFELERDISDLVENADVKWKKQEMKLPILGNSLMFYKDEEFLPEPDTQTDLKKYVKHKLVRAVASTNTELANVQLKPGASLSPLQHRLFCAMNCYQDLLYPKQTIKNTEEIRVLYCLHALNHVLKTRSRVIAHNVKVKSKKVDLSDDVDYRDQGLTRPKVLMLLPYRDRALKVVNMIIHLLSGTQQASVSNRKRFETEYSEMEKTYLSEKNYKPEDFRKIFEGNIDDNFRLGLSISKKSLRLYSPFYESDIILASPLGLRMIIGLEGDKERDFDFLSSIEVLIIDQADIFLMQNWDHFTHVFKHLHLQPRESHGVDFSRVRMWSVNGWSKFYRQTLIFSCALLPELLNIFNKHCHNYAGKILVQRDDQVGTIRSSVSDSPQLFHRIQCDAPDGLSQRKAKFDYLKKKIIPYYTSAGMKQALIYCNYYSFVMLRNYFRESEMDFLFMNEYDSEKSVRNARIHFRKRHPHFMLYTERLHFHYRFRLKGIHHIIWFDLPQYPDFYPELVNLMETNRQSCTTTALYTKYDAQKLVEIIGSKQAAHMLSSEKTVNMISMS
ncbi:U3 small nucleolar RNA-associated protein 25 homolog [Biomphalaria glabrata]|uniref:U3 small nucleolar RNA-associated protein 25 homolog n=1 Tax=Biomphalaria glabrata TaxID=6526 RepID=A0A9W2ZX94_BIOGL|nr:U3 small nucleolar RNA-associated protein 25 homolog [Biomphalaria glabrata]KAI8740692.1 putative digestive organ expansion factor isoform X1 [Biomphalaria glabrata]